MNSPRSIFSTGNWPSRIGLLLFALLLCQPTAKGQSQAPADDILSDQYGTAWGRTPYNRHTDRTPSGPLPMPGSLLPHAGDYVSSERNYYEIVYMPLQTRIYLYDRKFRPVGAQDVHAQMTLRLHMEAIARPIAFQFIPQPAGATEQDYAAAAFDIRPLQDKDVSVALEFTGLESAVSTQTFTPVYDHFAIRPYLAQAAVTAADQDAIARQRICPVTGVPLGSRGPVVKLYVAEFPLYLSGADCIAAVKQAPQRFVPQAPPMPNPGR